MITITVPASSANLGPGFDCLGLALDLYAYFDVDLSPDDDNHLSGFLSQYINNENLFLKAYRRGWKAIGAATDTDRPPYPLTVQFHSDVPISRGLGSSMTMIAGGLMAASVFGSTETDKPLAQRRALTSAQLFELSAKMEGHPDNAAPALFGGLTAALVTDKGPIYMPLPLSDKWQFTVFIPDFEVRTERARSVLPDVYPRSVAAANSAHALFLIKAFESGDLATFKIAANDLIHEPYRRRLIKDFDIIQTITEEDTKGRLLISGSGSTCLLVSQQPLSAEAQAAIEKRTDPCWKVVRVQPSAEGVTVI